MKNNNKSAFTLVELIIVIAIIAILAVTAFLVLTKWIAKSRDSARLSDLNTIDNALQISLTESNSLPKPDNYTLIYASGTTNVVGYQGEFSDNTAKALGNLSKAPKDGLDNTYYNYYVNSDATQYQLLGFTENSVAYNPSAVNAVDYSTRYAKLAGGKLGILVDSSNTPVNKLGLTGIDIKNTTTTYKAYFDSSTTVSGTGASLVSMLTLNNKNLASLDTGLVFYSDMETTVNSGSLVMLKDLSSYGNNGTCYNGSGNYITCGGSAGGPQFVQGVKGKGMLFDGNGDYINLGNITSWNTRGITMVAYARRDTDLSDSSDSDILDNQQIGWNINLRIAFRGAKLRSLSQDALSGNQQYEIYSDTTMMKKRYQIIGIANLDSKKIYLYIDGVKIGDYNIKITSFYSGSNIGSMLIGRHSHQDNEYLTGLLDEVRVYNRALSDDEVKALYNAN